MQKSGQRKKIVRCGMWAGLFLGIICGIGGCHREKVPAGTVGTGIPTPTATVTGSIVTLTPAPSPEPTQTPTGEPAVTKEPEKTVTPEPTETPTPTPTGIPEPTQVPETTGIPEVTEVPEPTPELPTITPEPTPVPEGPTLTPGVEPIVTPEAEPTPEVTPDGTPDYEALIIGGWQKTEDFFGLREIYFPGKFAETTLYAESGRYEYRYSAVGEPEVTFSVIGEEGMAVQLFLDSLAQKGEECTVWTEGENEYGYTYLDGLYMVTGRVYGCDTEATSRRMRVEFKYPEGTLQTEEYRFYIK